MLDLELLIQDWRESLTEGLRDEDLTELEGHLREEITQLAAKGLSTEEAFAVAARRLGGDRELCGEFAKVHPGVAAGRQFQWMIIGFLGISVLLSAFKTLSVLAAWAAVQNGWEGDMAIGLVGLVQAAGLAALILVLVRVARVTLPTGRRLLGLAVLLALAYPVVRFPVTLLLAKFMAPSGFGSVQLMILPGVYISWAAAILVPWILIRLGQVGSRRSHAA